jgi:hypothetical protein
MVNGDKMKTVIVFLLLIYGMSGTSLANGQSYSSAPPLVPYQPAPFVPVPLYKPAPPTALELVSDLPMTAIVTSPSVLVFSPGR